MITILQYYEDEKIPMSEMIQDLLMFYKYGGKQFTILTLTTDKVRIDLEKFDQPTN